MGSVCQKQKYTYVTNMPYKGGLYTGHIDCKSRPFATYGELQFDNSQYHGGFYKGLYHGDGTLRFSNGDYYSGEWAMGKKNGSGVEYYKEHNHIHTGVWKKDQLVE